MKFSDLVICSDLDGTLLNEENQISKENLEAIEYFRAEGGKFIIATGRMPSAVFPAVKDLKMDYPCICMNGCAIYDLGAKEYVEVTPLDDAVVNVAEEIMNASQELGVEVMNKDGIYVVKRNAVVDFHLEYEKISAEDRNSIEDVPKPWIKILFAAAPEEIDAARERLLTSPHHEKYNLMKTHRFYYEIFNKNASKGEALKKLCSSYNINLENVIAIGDNDNDISMLNVAGKSAAVENASDTVKQHADIITCSNEEHAIADLIKKL